MGIEKHPATPPARNMDIQLIDMDTYVQNEEENLHVNAYRAFSIQLLMPWVSEKEKGSNSYQE